MEDEDLQRLYTWLDEIPLSRPKRNIARDFSDGVMVAEVVNNFLPKIIDIHNYTPANSSKQKMNNWDTLNRKVFCKLGLVVPENVVKGIIDMKAGVIEVVLNNIRVKIEQKDSEYEEPPVYSPPKHSPSKGAHSPPKTIAPLPAARGGPQKSVPVSVASQGPSRSPPKQQPTAPARSKSEPARDLAQALLEKDQSLMDYQETVEILQVKVRKLEQLVLLKDKRIEELAKKLKQSGVKP